MTTTNQCTLDYSDSERMSPVEAPCRRVTITFNLPGDTLTSDLFISDCSQWAIVYGAEIADVESHLGADVRHSITPKPVAASVLWLNSVYSVGLPSGFVARWSKPIPFTRWSSVRALMCEQGSKCPVVAAVRLNTGQLVLKVIEPEHTSHEPVSAETSTMEAAQ